MTPDSIKKVHALQSNEDFASLTIEQLLYACVGAVGVKETAYCLHKTEWSEWCPNEQDETGT